MRSPESSLQFNDKNTTSAITSLTAIYYYTKPEALASSIWNVCLFVYCVWNLPKVMVTKFMYVIVTFVLIWLIEF